MSETKTVRDVLNEKRDAAQKLKEPRRPEESTADKAERAKYSEGFMDGLAYAEGRFEEAAILDYHIIPGAEAVVAPKGLLAAGHAYEDARSDALDTNDHNEQDYEGALVAGARAALEAAGIQCVDEVVEVACPSMSDALWVTDTRMLNDGDKLYIVRAVTASHSEEE